MDAGLYQVHKLLCGGKSAAIRAYLPVAAKSRRCPFFGSVMATLWELPSGVDGERQHWRNACATNENIGLQHLYQTQRRTAPGTTEYADAFLCCIAVPVVCFCSSRGCSSGRILSSYRKELPSMKKLSVRLLLAAAVLLLMAGTLFGFTQSWIYAGLIWSGAFGCPIAALNFRNAGSDNENHED